jgi:hypothetical protein
MSGAQLRVAPSQSKHKLYIGNIPRELTKEQLREQLDAAVKGRGQRGMRHVVPKFEPSVEIFEISHLPSSSKHSCYIYFDIQLSRQRFFTPGDHDALMHTHEALMHKCQGRWPCACSVLLGLASQAVLLRASNALSGSILTRTEKVFRGLPH